MARMGAVFPPAAPRGARVSLWPEDPAAARRARLLADPVARGRGDIVTVLVRESQRATHREATTLDQTTEARAGLGRLEGLPSALRQGLPSGSVSSARNFEAKGDTDRDGSLEARVTGALADFRPATLTGKLEASGTWREPEGAQVAALSGRLEAANGVVQLEPVVIGTPGATLSVKGSASGATLGLKGHLTSGDAGRTARALGLATESSYRFERGVDPIGVETASARAAELIAELAGGTQRAMADVGRRGR
jgi:hypothetical protein